MYNTSKKLSVISENVIYMYKKIEAPLVSHVFSLWICVPQHFTMNICMLILFLLMSIWSDVSFNDLVLCFVGDESILKWSSTDDISAFQPSEEGDFDHWSFSEYHFNISQMTNISLSGY